MKCIICKNNNYRVIKKIDGINIFECKNCGLGYVDQNETKNLNAKKFYNFKEYKKEETRLRMITDQLVSVIRNVKPNGKVLDVGAGFGLFSSILNQQNNYKITLLEPVNNPIYIKNIDIKTVKKNFLEFVFSTKEKFDILVLLDVLEHFENPKKALENAKRLLAKEAILVIQTPNYKSIMARICKNWSWWMTEDHKFFFSPKSINLLLNKLNYKITYFKTYEDFYDFKKNLDGNFTEIQNGLLRKLIKSIFFSFFIPFYFLFRRLIWASDHGGLMFIIASKR